MKAELTIAVTELARFCHRGGDIDHRFSPSPTGAEGTAGHRRWYAAQAPTYRTEYAVEHHYEDAHLRLTLRGRADGYDPEQAMVEEIKTCRVPPDAIPEAVAALHRAQGRLYAAVIAAARGLDALTVRVTWLNIDTDAAHTEEETLGAAELAAFLDDSLRRMSAWLRRLATLRIRRDDSAAGLDFPHGEFRAGQRRLAELTYKCVDQGGQLLVEAPTGIGKTAAVLFPALKALAAGKHDRVVFVTARTVGRRAAEDTLGRFRAAGFRGNALSLSAKESVCLSPGRACHGDDCPYARGYYDKLGGALDDAIGAPALTRADLDALARRHEVCPYELARDLLPWVDVVIADMHYLYSLHAGGDDTGPDPRRCTILLDEAHNLPGRARDMYSATLSKAQVLQAKRAAGATVARAFQRVNRQLLALAKETWQYDDYHSSESRPEGLLRAVADCAAAVAEAMARDPACLQREPPLRDAYFDILQFLRVAEQWGPEYRLQMTRGEGRYSLRVTLHCLDPARLLAARQNRAHAVVAFSATLSPLPWTRACLGLREETVCHRTSSPFEPQQLRVHLATGVDTRYRQREATLPALADLLRRWLANNPGNCILYFPAYRYLEDCLALLGREPVDRTLWVQRREDDAQRREELLSQLSERRDLAAFCILGGVFGEGIDLPGEQLASVVVVGLGMPQVNHRTRELQQWYECATAAGFDYTFVYPGMQKVAQALGRVVRCTADNGSALLIDPRYGQAGYRALLPPWWEYQNWRETDSGAE